MNVTCGKILKGIGGFYYVKTESGIIECRACGRFRKIASMPYVGDNVEIETDGSGTGYVTRIFERKNVFVRPPVSNVDKMIIVVSLKNPAPDLFFADKLVTIGLANGVDVGVCFSKSDLACDEEVERYKSVYEKSGCKVYVTSTLSGSGADEIARDIKGFSAVFSGFSGVGKSSLINEIVGYKCFDVGEVSKKLNRGKHTTRHVEFVEYAKDSYIIDTPGFSMLELTDNITKENLADYFYEFKDYDKMCKFADCTHENGKFCAVCSAVSENRISTERYENYRTMLETLKNKKEW